MRGGGSKPGSVPARGVVPLIGGGCQPAAAGGSAERPVSRRERTVRNRNYADSDRLWIIAAVAYFVSGLFVSEVWFGWATEEDLQPNIDGLSFDEVLLLGTFISILIVLVTWMVTRRGRTARHSPSH